MTRTKQAAKKTLKREQQQQKTVNTKTKSLGINKRSGVKKAHGLIPAAERTKRASPKYTRLTLAKRDIRREQRASYNTNVTRAKPFEELVRQIACEIDTEIRLRPSTVEAIKQIVDNAVVDIMSDALEMRVRGKPLSTKDKMKGTTVTVMKPHLEYAFKTWCKHKLATDFIDHMRNPVVQLSTEQHA